jgi:hypothetical protein
MTTPATPPAAGPAPLPGLAVNPRLATRPIDPKRRLPVPYVQLLRPDGTADFAAVNGATALRAAAARLCGLCGKKMGRWVAFIAGPQSIEHRAFLDPPMDVKCAEDALRLCPHMARERTPRRPEGSFSPEVITPAGFTEGKPNRFGLFITGRWQVHRNVAEGTYVFRPAPARTVRWFSYVNGVLTEEPRGRGAR